MDEADCIFVYFGTFVLWSASLVGVWLGEPGIVLVAAWFFGSINFLCAFAGIAGTGRKLVAVAMACGTVACAIATTIMGTIAVAAAGGSGTLAFMTFAASAAFTWCGGRFLADEIDIWH